MQDLESLLLAGLNTLELTEEEFWDSVMRRTDAIAAAARNGRNVIA